MSLLTTPRTWVAGEVVTAGQMNTEIRDAIAGLQAPWDSWSPTFTGLTVGNGLLVARYLQIGRTVQFRLSLVAGTGSTFSASFNFSLPIAVRGDYIAGVDGIGSAFLSRSTSASRVVAGAYLNSVSGSVCGMVVDRLAGGYTTSAVVGVGIPWTWSPGDTFSVDGSYEAA